MRLFFRFISSTPDVVLLAVHFIPESLLLQLVDGLIDVRHCIRQQDFYCVASLMVIPPDGVHCISDKGEGQCPALSTPNTSVILIYDTFCLQVAGLDPLQPVLGSPDQFPVIVDRVAVMDADHEEAEDIRIDFLDDVVDQDEVPKGLRHLFIVYIDVAVMHPVVCECAVRHALALCNLIFMVREGAAMTLHSMCQPGRPAPPSPWDAHREALNSLAPDICRCGCSCTR